MSEQIATKNPARETIFHIIFWVIHATTLIAMTIPNPNALLLCIPWIFGIIISIIALVKRRFITGISGLIWSTLGVWVWCLIINLI